MSNNPELDLQIKTLIQTQIIAALKSGPDLIEELVKAALEKPVDPSTGRQDQWGHGKTPYIDWLVGETIRDYSRGAVLKIMQDEIRPVIEEAIRKRLTDVEVAKAISTALVGTFQEDWRITIKFGAER